MLVVALGSVNDPPRKIIGIRAAGALVVAAQWEFPWSWGLPRVTPKWIGFSKGTSRSIFRMITRITRGTPMT